MGKVVVKKMQLLAILAALTLAAVFSQKDLGVPEATKPTEFKVQEKDTSSYFQDDSVALYYSNRLKPSGSKSVRSHLESLGWKIEDDPTGQYSFRVTEAKLTDVVRELVNAGLPKKEHLLLLNDIPEPPRVYYPMKELYGDESAEDMARRQEQYKEATIRHRKELSSLIRSVCSAVPSVSSADTTFIEDDNNQQKEPSWIGGVQVVLTCENGSDHSSIEKEIRKQLYLILPNGLPWELIKVKAEAGSSS